MTRVGWVRVLVLAVFCAGCVGSSGTSTDFAKKARRTVDQVHSAVVVGEHVLDLAKHGDATGPYLSVLIGEAEQDAIRGLPYSADGSNSAPFSRSSSC